MDLEFSGELWFWKGPAPWPYVTVPELECADLEATAAFVTYGWGMVPVKAWVRKAEDLELGDTVTIRLVVDA